MLGKKGMARKQSLEPIPSWRPFQEMRQELGNMMSGVIEDFFTGAGREWPIDLLGGRVWAPAVDVRESDKEYAFELELPGLEKDDFKVEMQEGTLIISGERKERKEEKTVDVLRHEHHFGPFRRAFSMPVDTDPHGIKAAYKNGILTVTVGRVEQAKPKAIPIDVE